ncbi:hypothetical protein JTB14_030256 [Gonioctena quinquepunctata]|nr:hypothetical protein JTB14_030256 [Gonioctena quinquepunctata]
MIVKFTIFMIPMPRLSNMKKKLAASSESEGDQEQQPGKRRIKQKKLLQNMKALSIHLLSVRSYSVKMNSGQVEFSKIVLANINI